MPNNKNGKSPASQPSIEAAKINEGDQTIELAKLSQAQLDYLEKATTYESQYDPKLVVGGPRTRIS